MASKLSDYQRLERKIEREYRRKGLSTKKASYIAHATAGKVARERRLGEGSGPTKRRRSTGTSKRAGTGRK